MVSVRLSLLVEVEGDDLPDVDPGDPHVRAGGELVGLWERHLEPIALRHERDRAPEVDPQIGEHDEAREHEHHEDRRFAAEMAGS